MNVKEGNHGNWNRLGVDLGRAVMSGLQFARELVYLKWVREGSLDHLKLERSLSFHSGEQNMIYPDPKTFASPGLRPAVVENGHSAGLACST